MKEILFIIIAIIFFKNYKSEGFALSSDDIPKAIADRMNRSKHTNDIHETNTDVKCPRKKIVENKKVKAENLSKIVNDGEKKEDKVEEKLGEKIEEKIQESVKVSGENTKKQLEKIEEIKTENSIVNQNQTDKQTKEIQDLIVSTSKRELDKLNEIDSSIQELKKRPIVKYPESNNKNTVLKGIIIFVVILLIGLFINYMMNKEPVIRRKIIRAPPLPPPPPPNIKLSLKEAKEIVTKNLMKYNV